MQDARTRILASFRRKHNLLLARHIRGLWTRNASMANARFRVATSDVALGQFPEGKDGSQDALIALEELEENGTLLIPRKKFPKEPQSGLVIYYCTLHSDLGHTRLCDALIFQSAQIVPHQTLCDAPVIQHTLASVSVCPQILSRGYLQTSLTLSDSSSLSTFHSLGVEDSTVATAATGDADMGYEGAVLSGCAHVPLIEGDVCIPVLMVAFLDYVRLLLDTLYLTTRRRKLEVGMWRAFLDHSLVRQTSALFLPDDPETPSVRLLEHFATLLLFSHASNQNPRPTTMDALYEENALVRTLVQGRTRLLANRIEAQFLQPLPDDADAMAPVQRNLARSLLIDQAHRNVCENVDAALKLGSAWHHLALLPEWDTEEPRYWRPYHEDRYAIAFWTMCETWKTLPPDSAAGAGTEIIAQGLIAIVTREQLLRYVLPQFQHWIALDECALWWERTSFHALPPAIEHIHLFEGRLLGKVSDQLRALQPDSGYSIRQTLLELEELCREAPTYYRPFTIRRDAELNPRRKRTHEETGAARWGKRLVEGRNYQPIGRDLLPDIESLTAYLPPCMRAVVRKAKHPQDHIRNDDRRTMGNYLKSLGYDGTATKKYLQTTELLYARLPVVPDGIAASLGCAGVRKEAHKKRNNPEYACRCPFASEGKGAAARCRQEANLPTRGLFFFHPLQFIEEKLAADRQ